MARVDPSGSPADVAELEVLRCCIELTADPGLGVDDDLWDAGLDSLEAVILCDTLADAGWGTIEPGDLVEARTARDVRRLLGRATPPTSTVVTYHADGTREPLFLVPPGGGTALAFVHLAAAFGSDRPLHVIEPRGMHRAGPVDRSVADLAEHVYAEVGARRAPRERCALISYSSGVPVAYEAACRLQADGRAVALVMLDAGPECPFDTHVAGASAGGPARLTPRTAGRWLRARASAGKGRPGGLVREAVRARPVRSERSRKAERLKALVADPGPPDLDPLRYEALLELALAAWSGYRPGPLDAPVLFVRAADTAAAPPDPTLVPRCTELVAGTDHASVILPPAVDAIAAATDRFLAVTRS